MADFIGDSFFGDCFVGDNYYGVGSCFVGDCIDGAGAAARDNVTTGIAVYWIWTGYSIFDLDDFNYAGLMMFIWGGARILSAYWIWLELYASVIISCYLGPSFVNLDSFNCEWGVSSRLINVCSWSLSLAGIDYILLTLIYLII